MFATDTAAGKLQNKHLISDQTLHFQKFYSWKTFQILLRNMCY